MMILTSKDFKKFGFKHVIEFTVPVMFICNEPVTAKMFKYKSIEDLKKEDWFKDSLVSQSPILLCKLRKSSIRYSLHKSDLIIFRMFHKD